MRSWQSLTTVRQQGTSLREARQPALMPGQTTLRHHQKRIRQTISPHLSLVASGHLPHAPAYGGVPPLRQVARSQLLTNIWRTHILRCHYLPTPFIYGGTTIHRHLSSPDALSTTNAPTGGGVYSQSTLLKRIALVAGALIRHCTNGRAVFPITCWVALAPTELRRRIRDSRW